MILDECLQEIASSIVVPFTKGDHPVQVLCLDLHARIGVGGEEEVHVLLCNLCLSQVYGNVCQGEVDLLRDEPRAAEHQVVQPLLVTPLLNLRRREVVVGLPRAEVEFDASFEGRLREPCLPYLQLSGSLREEEVGAVVADSDHGDAQADHEESCGGPLERPAREVNGLCRPSTVGRGGC